MNQGITIKICTSGKRVTGKTGSQVRILFSPLYCKNPPQPLLVEGDFIVLMFFIKMISNISIIIANFAADYKIKDLKELRS